MKIYNKKPLSTGIAIGKVFNFINTKNTVSKSIINDTDIEIVRLNNAYDFIIASMETSLKKAISVNNKAEIDIINAHQMIIKDSSLLSSIVEVIKEEKVNAEYAVNKGFSTAISLLDNVNDTYIKERVHDYHDICNQIIDVLSSKDVSDFDEYGVHNASHDPTPIVLFADTLSPSEFIKLNKSNICAFVLNKCPVTSHTAILIKAMNVPLISGKKNNLSHAGKMCIVDGITGTIYIDPDNDLIDEYNEKKLIFDEKEKELTLLKNLDTVTKSNKRINLYANIGNINDLELASLQGAEGIGLLRSEVIYLKTNDFPSEDYQYDIYKRAVESFKDTSVTIRTLDINVDKLPEYISIHKDENGLFPRGIKYCLIHEDVFRTQLRAILRASLYNDISILYPMVNTKEEIIKAKEIVNSVKTELLKENIPFGSIKQGATIETKEAVNNCRDIAKECDFISVGTNDLSDDLFGDDTTRSSEVIITDYKERVLYDTLKEIIECSHSVGKTVCICGEIASNHSWTNKLIRIGTDSLSVSPGEILRLRQKIRSIE